MSVLDSLMAMLWQNKRQVEMLQARIADLEAHLSTPVVPEPAEPIAVVEVTADEMHEMLLGSMRHLFPDGTQPVRFIKWGEHYYLTDKATLLRLLAEDDTSTFPWVNDMGDCVHFSMRTVASLAFRGVTGVLSWAYGGKHMYVTYPTTDGEVVNIEPQTDAEVEQRYGTLYSVPFGGQLLG